MSLRPGRIVSSNGDGARGGAARAQRRLDSRPSRASALAALGLDVTYVSGRGSLLWAVPGNPDLEGGATPPDSAHAASRPGATPVWDFLGGYGSTFFGHNHPKLKRVVRNFLDRDGVVHGQGSRRSTSDRLRAALGDRLAAAFGEGYAILFGSTGAEAVEMAARHAEGAWAEKRNDLRACLEMPWKRTGSGKDESVPFPDAGPLEPPWSEAARRTLAGLDLLDPGRSLSRIEAHNRRVLREPPILFALRGSFHGMTAWARALTDDPVGRFGPRTSGYRIRFLPRTAVEPLADELRARTNPVVRVIAGDDRWEVQTVDWTSVAAFFVEPIQGEGGIHPLEPRTAWEWSRACRARGVPLVVDEIQTGMGRTGSFLFSEQLGLVPDYVLLGKSLGGGLVKISAVAVRQGYFRPAFTLEHASTFAEDDLSSAVALRALELLDEDGSMAQGRETGERLIQALSALAERFPTLIREVRGRGLMIGIEWREQVFERSLALRWLQEHGWLGYALAAYLLRRHGVRVAPALSATTLLRIEPACSVPRDAVRCLISGLEELCVVLERQDSAGLLGPCLGACTPGNGALASYRRASRPDPADERPATILRRRAPGPHVGFIGHFIDANSVGLWDPGLGRLGAEECGTFLDRVRPLAEPLLCHRDRVSSLTGATTTLSFIGIPVGSGACHAALRDGTRRRELRRLIQRAVDLATREGCEIVGLGGYTSILTRNGKDLMSRGMTVTTGNGYTVGSGLLALEAGARSQGLDLSEIRAAVIGALGNIGSVFAELLAPRVGSLLLVGREKRRTELEAAAARLPSRLPVQVHSSTRACQDAQVVVVASNSAEPVLFPEDLGTGPTVILDLGVPRDVDPRVSRARPRARLVQGGVIRIPLDPSWSVPGIPLPPGYMFACMAETALIGLERSAGSGDGGGGGHRGSLGRLTSERVLETLRMAHRHGFEPASPPPAVSCEGPSRTAETSLSVRHPGAGAPGPWPGSPS